jgi:hypothetical protein
MGIRVIRPGDGEQAGGGPIGVPHTFSDQQVMLNPADIARTMARYATDVVHLT